MDQNQNHQQHPDSDTTEQRRGLVARVGGRWRGIVDRWRHRWDRWVSNSVEASLPARIGAHVPACAQSRRGRIIIGALSLLLVLGWGIVLVLLIG